LYRHGKKNQCVWRTFFACHSFFFSHRFCNQPTTMAAPSDQDVIQIYLAQESADGQPPHPSELHEEAYRRINGTLSPFIYVEQHLRNMWRHVRKMIAVQSAQAIVDAYLLQDAVNDTAPPPTEQQTAAARTTGLLSWTSLQSMWHHRRESISHVDHPRNDESTIEQYLCQPFNGFHAPQPDPIQIVVWAGIDAGRPTHVRLARYYLRVHKAIDAMRRPGSLGFMHHYTLEREVGECIPELTNECQQRLFQRIGMSSAATPLCLPHPALSLTPTNDAQRIIDAYMNTVYESPHNLGPPPTLEQARAWQRLNIINQNVSSMNTSDDSCAEALRRHYQHAKDSQHIQTLLRGELPRPNGPTDADVSVFIRHQPHAFGPVRSRDEYVAALYSMYDAAHGTNRSADAGDNPPVRHALPPVEHASSAQVAPVHREDNARADRRAWHAAMHTPDAPPPGENEVNLLERMRARRHQPQLQRDHALYILTQCYNARSGRRDIQIDETDDPAVVTMTVAYLSEHYSMPSGEEEEELNEPDRRRDRCAWHAAFNTQNAPAPGESEVTLFSRMRARHFPNMAIRRQDIHAILHKWWSLRSDRIGVFLNQEADPDIVSWRLQYLAGFFKMPTLQEYPRQIMAREHTVQPVAQPPHGATVFIPTRQGASIDEPLPVDPITQIPIHAPNQCIVCQTNTYKLCFVPCGHIVSCHACFKKLGATPICHLCRAPVVHAQTIFI
jgi:hypothetical protein